MKTKIIITALFVICNFATAQKQLLKKSVADKAVEFFTLSLNGDTAARFHYNKKIAITDIERVQNEIWECWRTAVERFDEEKLPLPLDANNKRDTLYWKMPDHPEPNTVMPFHYIKKGDKPDNGYPLFLYMHGSGSKEREWDTGYHLCKGFVDAPSLYFIPQIPSEKLYRWAVVPQQTAWEKLLRLALLSDYIDRNRIYLFGISEGGYGSQRLASFYADYIAGAGPMAGGEPLQNAPAENLANIAFSLRTGEHDHGFWRNTLTKAAAHTLDSLAMQHPGLYNHNIVIIPGRGHGIDYSETTPWLAQFERTPHPTYFYWEDYEMYGRHRHGFYNIRVDEPSCDNEQQRSCYEMLIENNTVYLTVKNVTYAGTDFMNGVPMLFDKSYTEACNGRVTVFLGKEHIDLEKPVKIMVNGKERFHGKVKPCIQAMAESCALFFDPERVFPASVEISIE